ncbi:MAG: hypothetical protein AAFX87_06750 [Bacteroidota bacterium]
MKKLSLNSFKKISRAELALLKAKTIGGTPGFECDSKYGDCGTPEGGGGGGGGGSRP